MRRYLAKIRIPENLDHQSVGYIGEQIFKLWFKRTFEDEQLFKQKADREYQQIDFSDEKGYTYQIKTTSKKSYTFNCSLDKIDDHLNSYFYVFIQLKNNHAYIEPIKNREDILDNINKSFINDSCYIKARDLQQQEIDIS
jgi:hypothetical protein|tara:strand:- start:8094 stop:8513 length:420 start_codon:yes stop_codon:yes gene_type:complete